MRSTRYFSWKTAWTGSVINESVCVEESSMKIPVVDERLLFSFRHPPLERCIPEKECVVWWRGRRYARPSRWRGGNSILSSGSQLFCIFSKEKCYMYPHFQFWTQKCSMHFGHVLAIFKRQASFLFIAVITPCNCLKDSKLFPLPIISIPVIPLTSII